MKPRERKVRPRVVGLVAFAVRVGGVAIPASAATVRHAWDSGTDRALRRP